MDDKQICAQLRPKFSTVGLVLLIYYVIMNVMVIQWAVCQSIVLFLQGIGGNPDFLLSEDLIDSVLDAVANSGWGYLLATAAGALGLLLWKKKHFCFTEIWQVRKSMTAGSFLQLLCLFLSAQALVQLMIMGLEWFFNLFNMSIVESMESMSISGSTFSMFLYMGLAAPVFEEILFRGYVLRTLEPYGKKFAILGSAFLFGIFHGNIIQSPFAFLVGLILGYVTLEYSVGWAMVLHMINNLILSDSLNRIMQLLPPWVGELIFAAVIWGSLLAALVILLAKRRRIRAYFSGGKIHPLCLKSFFTSPGILVLTGVMLLIFLLNILLMVISQL